MESDYVIVEKMDNMSIGSEFVSPREDTNELKDMGYMQNIFENKAIGNLIFNIKKSVVNLILNKATKYAEFNDISNFNSLYEDILYLRNKNFSKKDLETLIFLLDRIIVKNYQDLNLIQKPFHLLTKFLPLCKQKNFLDWKIYYKIYFILQGHPCYEFSYHNPLIPKTGQQRILKFFSTASKYFKFSKEDLVFIKSEIMRLLFSGNEQDLIFGLKVVNFFYPKEELKKDSELQNILYTIMINRNHTAMSIFNIFKKIIKKGFSIPIQDFIDHFFNIVNNYINKTIFIGQGFPTYKKKSANGNGSTLTENFSNKPILEILSALLFSEIYSDFRNTTDKHFSVLLNLINYNLKENSTKEIINYNLNFVKGLLSSAKDFNFVKTKIEVNQFETLKEFKLDEIKKERLYYIIKKVEPIIIKSMFYDENSAIGVLSDYQKLTESLEIEKIIFETFVYIYENSDINFNSFIKKFTAFIKLFIKESSFKDPNSYALLTNVITSSIDKISSVSLELNNNILNMFTNLYLICSEKIKEDNFKNLQNFCNFYSILQNSTVNISKKIISLFQMFTTGKNQNIISMYLMSAANLNKGKIQNINEIENIFINYLEENVLDKAENVNFYFPILNQIKSENWGSKYKKIFDFCFKSLLSVIDVKKDSSQIKEDTLTYPKHYLVKYQPSKNYQLDVYNDKKLKYIKLLLKNISYEYISNEDFKINYFDLIATLLIQNDIKYHKLIFSSLNKVISQKMNPYLIKNPENESDPNNRNNKFNFKVRLPTDSDLDLVIQIYNYFILPYIEYIRSNIDIFNQKFEKYLKEIYPNTEISKKDRKKSAKKFIKESEDFKERDILEKNLIIYLRLQNSFVSILEKNPILLYLSGNLENQDIEQEIKSSLGNKDEEYQKYLSITEIKKTIKDFHTNLFGFVSLFNFNKNNLVNKFYARGVICQNIDFSGSHISKTNSNYKARKKIIKNLSNKEKSILNYYNLLESYYTQLRLLKLEINLSENKKNSPQISQEKGKNKIFQSVDKSEEKKLLIKNIKLLADLSVDSTDKKLNASIGEHLKYSLIVVKLPKKKLEILYENILKKFKKIISKIKLENSSSSQAASDGTSSNSNLINISNIISSSSSLLISDKTKISNILNFYSNLIKWISLLKPELNIKITSDALEIITLISEKNFNELIIISKTLISEIARIRLELPKCYYLINKKLNNFPFLNDLEKNHKFGTTKKIEKIISKISTDKFNITKLKIENQKSNLTIEANKLYFLFASKLSSDTITQNKVLSYILIIHVLMSMLYTLNPTKEEDYILMSKYEQIFYKDLLSDANYLQKRMSFIFWGLILRIKHKINKKYEIQILSDEEYKKSRSEIILSTRDNISGLSNYNIKYLKTSKSDDEVNFAHIDAPIISSLNKKEDFEKLISSLILLKDTLNDQSLMKTSSPMSMLRSIDSFDSIDIILNFLQNPHNKMKLSNVFFAESLTTQNLFDQWDSNFFFHILNLYKVKEIYNYENILNTFQKIVSDSNKDKLVTISVLLHVISGIIKSEIKECVSDQNSQEKFKNISQNIFKIMKYFTYNTNKRIDSDILKYFTFIIENLSVNEFKKIFFNNWSDSGIPQEVELLKLDPDFQLKFFNLASKNFSQKSKFIFTSPENKIVEIDKNLSNLENLLVSYLSDREKLVKNLLILKLSIPSILLFSGNIYYNFDNFEYEYDIEKSKNYFEKILTISKNTEIKEMKQLCSYLVFMYKKFFISQPDLLIEFLLEISKVTYLDIEDFDRHLALLRKSFQFPCYKINIGKYLSHVENNLNALDNIHSRKFFVDLLSNLFKSNLNNYNTTNNYRDSLDSIFRMINNSQHEIKEYIVNNLLIIYIHSLDDEVNNKIINDLKNLIQYQGVNLKTENISTLNTDLSPLSVIFILGTYLKSFDLEIPENIQNLIISLKEFNSKVFKNRGAESKLIKSLMADFFNKYKYTFNYAKRNMSEKCCDAIQELSRTKSYFL
jgi:hypothetical protein